MELLPYFEFSAVPDNPTYCAALRANLGRNMLEVDLDALSGDSQLQPVHRRLGAILVAPKGG